MNSHKFAMLYKSKNSNKAMRLSNKTSLEINSTSLKKERLMLQKSSKKVINPLKSNNTRREGTSENSRLLKMSPELLQFSLDQAVNFSHSTVCLSKDSSDLLIISSREMPMPM
jgi:hypothetical protein